MKKSQLKQLIREVVNQVLNTVGEGGNEGHISSKKNPFKVGDKVTLRHDVLRRHSKSVPTHAGFNTNQFDWRKTLDGIGQSVGVIDRLFDNSKHVNVKFDGHGVIGIDFTELVPYPAPSEPLGLAEITKRSGLTK